MSGFRLADRGGRTTGTVRDGGVCETSHPDAAGYPLSQSSKHHSWPDVADLLVKTAAALKANLDFAREVSISARRLAIPQPAAVVEARVYRAVARRCTELVDLGDHRQAAALLVGHKHAVKRWTRYSQRWPPRNVVDSRMPKPGPRGPYKKRGRDDD